MAKLRFPRERPISDAPPGKWRSGGVGIDVHKDMVWAGVWLPSYQDQTQGRHRCRFASTPTGLESLEHWLNEIVPTNERHYLVESTSTYHFPVMLSLKGWTPTVINPKIVGAAKRKTDRWDAQKLAHHDRVATFPSYTLPTPEEQALRIVLRRYLKVRRAVSRSTNAIRSRMAIYGVNYGGSFNSEERMARWRGLCGGEHFEVGRVDPEALRDLMVFRVRSRTIPRCVRLCNGLQLDEIEYIRRQADGLWELALQTVEPRSLLLLRSVPHISLCLMNAYGRG